MPRPAEQTRAARLLRWHRRRGRHDLPWQQQRTPYRIWISEIMLQQTRVVSVIPYYQRFLARFPDLDTLAAADPEPEAQVDRHAQRRRAQDGERVARGRRLAERSRRSRVGPLESWSVAAPFCMNAETDSGFTSSDGSSPPASACTARLWGAGGAPVSTVIL